MGDMVSRTQKKAFAAHYSSGFFLLGASYRCHWVLCFCLTFKSSQEARSGSLLKEENTAAASPSWGGRRGLIKKCSCIGGSHRSRRLEPGRISDWWCSNAGKNLRGDIQDAWRYHRRLTLRKIRTTPFQEPIGEGVKEYQKKGGGI